MKKFDIENIKKATSMMFAEETLDRFLIAEVTINMLMTFSIDGRINDKFLTAEEKEQSDGNEYVRWSDIRKVCFEIIKGKKQPTGFKFVFKLPKENIPGFLKRNNIENINPDDINALFMNMKFENGLMTCITGTSLKTFNVGDRQVDDAWDMEIGKFVARINNKESE